MSSWSSGTSTPSNLSPDMPHERQDISQHIGQQNANNRRVGLELGKSSVVNQRKLRSKIWEDFDKYDDENGKHRAKCKVCKKVFDGSSKLGTTHLKNHLRSCQRKKNGDGGGDEPANFAGNLSNPIAIEENSVRDQQSNPMDMARMIIKQGGASLINLTNVVDIIDVYKEEKEKLRNYFEKLSRRLCLTVGRLDRGHTCLTVWFIDDDWKLKKKIIGYKCLEEIEIIVEYIKNMILEWGIENNLSSIVVVADDDNHLYQMMYNEIRKGWFSTQGSLLFKNQLLRSEDFSSHCDGRNNIFLNAISYHVCESLSRLFDEIEYPSSTNEDFRNAIDVAIKSLAVEVITALRGLYGFLSCGEETDLWGVLKKVLGLKETFFDLENSHPHFQNLTEEEWDVLGVIYECFKDYGDFLLQYCSNYNTANTHFPLLCKLYKCSKELRKCHINTFYDIIERIDNYWCDYHLVLAVASALDPRFRMDIVKIWYKQIFGDEWETKFRKFTIWFTKIYNEYARDINNLKECTSGLEENNSSFSSDLLDPLGRLCKSSHELYHVQWLNSELRLFFEEVKFPSIKDFDVLEWWRVHARCFPTLARMACDVLSVQISCSCVRISDDEMYYLKKIGIEEAYTCTKSWLREEL